MVMMNFHVQYSHDESMYAIVDFISIQSQFFVID